MQLPCNIKESALPSRNSAFILKLNILCFERHTKSFCPTHLVTVIFKVDIKPFIFKSPIYNVNKYSKDS